MTKPTTLLKRSSLAFGFVLLLTSRASANGLLPCVDGATLDTYIALGSTGCTVDDKVFYDFGYEVTIAEGVTAVMADAITVQTILAPDDSLGHQVAICRAPSWTRA